MNRSGARFVSVHRLLWAANCVASATLTGCGIYIDKQALAEFTATHPDAKVYEQFVGEGDDQSAYMHFRYTVPTSPDSFEQMWLYQKQEGGWRVIAKVGPKSPGSL